MGKEVVILVPIYQSTLTADEQIGVNRLLALCHGKEIRVVAPTGLSIPTPLDGLDVDYFAPSYFDGIEGYNRLMMSAAFYMRYADYRYILIHQTDAFLFADRIDEWCAKGYSYVGAPWLIKRKYKGMGRLLLYPRAIAKWLRGQRFLPFFLGNKVGNGGLSLRKVNDFLRVCNDEKAENERWIEKSKRCREYNEDCYWATRITFSYPTAQEALGFSMDIGAEDAMAQNGGELPMGCHGWTKDRYRSFWWNYIESFLK